MVAQRRIRAVVMRGGTSRGVFFHRSDLPGDPAVRDRVILKAFGGGDPYGQQVDGLGGATSVTSKVVIISSPSMPDADVDYTFGQVSVTKPLIDFGGTCGNLTAAVGVFAIEEGFAEVSGPFTRVRIWQTNTRKRINALVPTAKGVPDVDGDYVIDGVPGAGARITLEFLEPGGSMTGSLLPTGRAAEALAVPGVGEVTVSLVDAVNPVVFVRPEDLGLSGFESPDEVGNDSGLLARIEAVRAHAGVRMGLAATAEEVGARSPGVPKIAFVRPPAEKISSGKGLAGAEIDLVGRIMTMGRLHRAFAVSGACCTAVAALIEGTVVHEVLRGALVSSSGCGSEERIIRIAHPSGVIEVGATVSRRGGRWVAEKVIAHRTARRLMEGAILVPLSAWPEGMA
jgi:2-methylaconitate cis-trans-isomerase PrpF